MNWQFHLRSSTVPSLQSWSYQHKNPQFCSLSTIIDFLFISQYYRCFGVQHSIQLQESHRHLILFLYISFLSLIIHIIFKQSFHRHMQYNRNQSQRLLKILIIGNSGVGKSCMLMRYVQNNFTTAFYNTIGVDFKMKNIELDGRKVRLQIWDTAGQDRFRTITSTYYKGAHGIILVYDVTDRESFDSLKYWMQEIQKYAHEYVDKIIVANKCDNLQKRRVSYDEGFSFAKNHGLQFLEVSAMSSSNIAEAFEVISRKVLKRMGTTPLTNRLPPSQLNTVTTSQKSSGCCG